MKNFEKEMKRLEEVYQEATSLVAAQYRAANSAALADHTLAPTPQNALKATRNLGSLEYVMGQLACQWQLDATKEAR